MIRRLLEMGADINAEDRRGITPLIGACGEGQEAVAHLLLDLGADGSKGKYADALHYACEKGLVSAIRRLVEMGADVDALDVNGWTPLMQACCRGQEAAAHLLLDLGADVKKGMYRGYYALHYARKKGLASVVCRLSSVLLG